MTSLEERIALLEDRTAISDVVIRYCMAVDTRDWELFSTCFDEAVTTEYDAYGDSVQQQSREEMVAYVASVLDGFTKTQHLSSNHVIRFGPDGHDAVCRSQMHAQHFLDGETSDQHYVLRAIYDNHMVRTAAGWRISGIHSHHRWVDGNEEQAIGEARARAAHVHPGQAQGQ